MSQPIIRGIQAVGAVDILYRYNSGDNSLPLMSDAISLGVEGLGDGVNESIDTSGGIKLAGFRLDGEFLRAVQQIASSVVIPVLGGGGVALTNNNRTGTLTINCAKVSSPSNGDYVAASTDENGATVPASWASQQGEMIHGNGFGPVGSDVHAYDMVFIAQCQQAVSGGDSVGATIAVCFQFCGTTTIVQFDGCTVASVDPIGLSGNDAASYSVSINYLNWKVFYNQKTAAIQAM